MSRLFESQPDPDIIDYNFVKNAAWIVDLTGEGGTHALEVPVFILELKRGAGARTRTEFENNFRDALCVSAIRSVYALEALGLSPKQTRDRVNQKLTKIDIEKTIRYGRAACRKFTGCQSADELELQSRQKFSLVTPLKGMDRLRGEAIENELKSLQLLNHAFSRSVQLIQDLYNSGKKPTEAARQKAREEAIKHRRADLSLNLPQCLLLSSWTFQNVAWLWPGFWFYRYILDAVAVLGPLSVACAVSLTPLQVYVLYRMCESEPSGYSDHEVCKRLLRRTVDLTFGLDHFLEIGTQNLENLGLLTPRPGSTDELTTRCAEIGNTVRPTHLSPRVYPQPSS